MKIFGVFFWKIYIFHTYYDNLSLSTDFCIKMYKLRYKKYRIKKNLFFNTKLSIFNKQLNFFQGSQSRRDFFKKKNETLHL